MAAATRHGDGQCRLPSTTPRWRSTTRARLQRGLALVLAAADLVGNDSDSDGDTLTVTAWAIRRTARSLVAGQIAFTPAPTTPARPPSPTRSGRPGRHEHRHGQRHRQPVNDAPVAVDDSFDSRRRQGPHDPRRAADLRGNDSDTGHGRDADGDGGGQADQRHGRAIGDGRDRFTPAANFNGTASFTYTISDGNGGTDTATVTVTVTPVNERRWRSTTASSIAEDSAVPTAAADRRWPTTADAGHGDDADGDRP